jgi:hypothetical protein
MPPTVGRISLVVPSGIWTERNANKMLPFLFIHPAEEAFWTVPVILVPAG